MKERAFRRAQQAVECPTPLGSVALSDGGMLRYLGYASAIYEQEIDPTGTPRLMRQYATWAAWPDSTAARQLAVLAGEAVPFEVGR